jgi:ubiquitin-protein ligase
VLALARLPIFNSKLESVDTNWRPSSSPLNGEAAELWDKDAEEFKRKVMGRHRDIDDD